METGISIKGFKTAFSACGLKKNDAIPLFVVSFFDFSPHKFTAKALPVSAVIGG